MEPRRHYASVFWTQQAAEKGLKADYWHLLAEEPEWTHYLARIAAMVAECGGGMPEEIASAITELTSGFERSRYPSGDVDEPIPVDLISEADAHAAVAHTEIILTWVESLLQLPTGKPKRRRS